MTMAGRPAAGQYGAMNQTAFANRRQVLAGAIVLAAGAPISAHAQSVLEPSTLGLTANSGLDQSAVLQRALDLAAAAGQILRLPAGNILASNLIFPSNLIVEGVPGSTVVSPADGGIIANIVERNSVVLRDIIFAGAGSAQQTPALLNIERSATIALERCTLRDAPATGLRIFDAAVTIRDCSFSQIGDAAIHSMDSRGLIISGNRITYCGNAGIRIWRGENGSDGSIITGNRIANIDWRGGGNGQNGNGINVFWADEVVIADNHIADCAFTAIRLNSTNNTQVSGNICMRSGEVAIFSEFGFSGSIIANNIIDGAATGISITNLDSGGQLAVCSGNIVRNITPASAVNPDTIPIGIFAEAETAITGNTVQNVPGVAIAAGYGSFLRNVMISGNVISASTIGIGVSVAEGAGTVLIGRNAISGADKAVVGLAWSDVVEADLIANAGRYRNVTID
jgi:uncharacterized secreted repeat protein (TIGR03808 family)